MNPAFEPSQANPTPTAPATSIIKTVLPIFHLTYYLWQIILHFFLRISTSLCPSLIFLVPFAVSAQLQPPGTVLQSPVVQDGACNMRHVPNPKRAGQPGSGGFGAVWGHEEDFAKKVAKYCDNGQTFMIHDTMETYGAYKGMIALANALCLQTAIDEKRLPSNHTKDLFEIYIRCPITKIDAVRSQFSVVKATPEELVAHSTPRPSADSPPPVGATTSTPATSDATRTIIDRINRNDGTKSDVPCTGQTTGVGGPCKSDKTKP
jgi:hypothetical protein